jgi:hypothetical protein
MTDRAFAPAGDSHHLTRLADGAPGSPGDCQGSGTLGATLGREFSNRCRLCALGRGDLTAGLQRWWRRSFYTAGTTAQATYLFKHALIQEAAYQSLLKSTRHSSSALLRCWRRTFPTSAEPAQLLAHHGEQALREQPWLLAKEGPAASERSANLDDWASPQDWVSSRGADTAGRTQHELCCTPRWACRCGPRVLAPRSWAGLRPGTGAVPAGGRDAAARPGAAGTVGVL